MRRYPYFRRNLSYRWAVNSAVALGVMVGASIMAGALLVGHSMRESLKAHALRGLGRIDGVLSFRSFVSQDFAERLEAALDDSSRSADSAREERASSNRNAARFSPGPAVRPVLMLSGSTTAPGSGRRSLKVQVLGIDSGFWALQASPVSPSDTREQIGRSPSEESIPDETTSGRNVILNEALASDLGVKSGDDLVIQVEKPAAISLDHLLGRRGDALVRARVTVKAVYPDDGLFSLSLNPGGQAPRNLFISLTALQELIEEPDLITHALVGAGPSDAFSLPSRIHGAMQLIVTPADAALMIKPVAVGREGASDVTSCVQIQSRTMLISSELERAIREKAKQQGVRAVATLAYLANRISRADDKPVSAPGNGPAGLGISAHDEPQTTHRKSVPYSTVLAVEGPDAWWRSLESADGAAIAPPGREEAVVSRWLADALGLAVGDAISLGYYRTESGGALAEQSATFKVAAIAEMAGPMIDRSLIPSYRGMTDSRNISDWDPPFPLDLKQIEAMDETYWDQYGPAAKIIIGLEDGERLWSDRSAVLGRLTGLRLFPPQNAQDAQGGRNEQDETGAMDLVKEAVASLEPEAWGAVFDPIRSRFERSAVGATDFGVLFLSFSVFLFASAALLTALLFDLGVRQRAKELGLHLVMGFRPGRLLRLLTCEAAVVGGVGALAAAGGAPGYSALMIAGLKSWWSDAAHVPFLALHISASMVVCGLAAAWAVALITTILTLRRVLQRSPHALLSGADLEAAGTAASPLSKRIRGADPPRGQESAARRFGVGWGAGAGFLAALLTIASSAFTKAFPPVAAFFLGGAFVLLGGMMWIRRRLRHVHRGLIRRRGLRAWLAMGGAGVTRNPGRSLVTVVLIASAAFLVISLQAFRLEADLGEAGRGAGLGGFDLICESAVPMAYDPGQPAGRASLGVSTAAEAVLKTCEAVSFRVRSGDETSCLNLYQPIQPRILGATPRMIERGGFRFASTLAREKADRENPWRLLNWSFEDGAIPVMGDEAAVMWQLHSGLGRDWEIQDDAGRPVKMRFVALLRGSLLQNELIIAEEAFKHLFPSRGGYGFMLVAVGAADRNEVATLLEKELADYGLDATVAADRLAALFAVQNTYLATFQTLGGLGLILGTLGLAVVLVRNVIERRAELAMMRALGFSRGALGMMVLGENASLVAWGLGLGGVSALVALLPTLIGNPRSVSVSSAALVIVGVFTAGVAGGGLALIPALRTPLLPALRRE